MRFATSFGYFRSHFRSHISVFFSCPPYVQGQAHAARTHVKLLHDIAVSDLCMLNFLTVVGYLGSVYYAVDTFHALYFLLLLGASTENLS